MVMHKKSPLFAEKACILLIVCLFTYNRMPFPVEMYTHTTTNGRRMIHCLLWATNIKRCCLKKWNFFAKIFSGC